MLFGEPERIDVDYEQWMHTKNQIVALEVLIKVQFAAIVILASCCGILMIRP